VIVAGAASIIGVLAFSMNRNDQDQSPPTIISNFEHGPSIFNIPDTNNNGTSTPLFSDTSEKETIFVTSENLTSFQLATGQYFGSFDFCGREEDQGTLVPGESFNPADVRIGAEAPTVIAFCAYNDFEKAHLYYLRIKDDSYSSSVPSGADYDTDITGLDFELSTRTIDLPAFYPNQDQPFINGTFVAERIYLRLTANSNAPEGVHQFSLDLMEPGSRESGGGYTTLGLGVYVNVTR
jgi:hypothetical protein